MPESDVPHSSSREDGTELSTGEWNSLTPSQLFSKMHLLNNEIRVMQNDLKRTEFDVATMKVKIRENKERIKNYVVLPLLVSDVQEIWADDQRRESDDMIPDKIKPNQKCTVIKTSTKRIFFLDNSGLLDQDKLLPGDGVCVSRDSFILLDKLPKNYDPRVKAMEVTEKPVDSYSDIGGLEKQIQELIEAVVLPLKMKEKFSSLGIKPPKGVLLFGPPGTGKTLLARACARETQCCFLKLAGPQLVQNFIGDGAKIVRDAFALAREKAPSIIFIDEIDAVGAKRHNGGKSGDREVHRTLIELLNQMDGFSRLDKVIVIGATNRVDILDPALLRSGRMDKKIELPEPDEAARNHVMQIHSRKMKISSSVDFTELARSTDSFNSAMCKAVCTEAAMLALKRNSREVTHEDFMEAVTEVQAKKKGTLSYFS